MSENGVFGRSEGGQLLLLQNYLQQEKSEMQTLMVQLISHYPRLVLPQQSKLINYKKQLIISQHHIL
ncbi:hypothetical protein ADH76_29790 [Enterocloster clostridioformis]|nr:hypothetical protein A4V08_04455 [Lachnoclostridium sp. YL32]OXE63530.1 hypothetical protein ADH76_29790 [Enterocloster clostridioformis]